MKGPPEDNPVCAKCQGSTVTLCQDMRLGQEAGVRNTIKVVPWLLDSIFAPASRRTSITPTWPREAASTRARPTLLEGIPGLIFEDLPESLDPITSTKHIERYSWLTEPFEKATKFLTKSYDSFQD
jgi:hypothetical protein